MKFDVYGTFSFGKFLGQVEADTKEEAEEKAERELDGTPSLCWQCAREVGGDIIFDSLEAEESTDENK